MPAGGTFFPVDMSRSARGLIRCIRDAARAGDQPGDIRTVVHHHTLFAPTNSCSQLLGGRFDDQRRASGAMSSVVGMTAELPEDDQGYSPEEEDQLTAEDTLLDRGVDDLLDEGYSPPERWQEPREHESLDERLADEQPDPALDENYRPDEQAGDDEVGDRRSGRLVAPDEGSGVDTEKELLGSDVGIDGGAASAEEAAVHIIDE